jgi:hypothetical protein
LGVLPCIYAVLSNRYKGYALFWLADPRLIRTIFDPTLPLVSIKKILLTMRARIILPAGQSHHIPFIPLLEKVEFLPFQKILLGPVSPV